MSFKELREKAGMQREAMLKRAAGGRTEEGSSNYARGGKAKGKHPTVNIMIAQPAEKQAVPVPVKQPVPVPVAAGPGAGGPPGMPPRPPVAGMGAPPGAMPPSGAMPPRKRGGSVKMTAGAESGAGRLQKSKMKID